MLRSGGSGGDGAGADDEPVYPSSFRPPAGSPLPPLGDKISISRFVRYARGEESGEAPPEEAV